MLLGRGLSMLSGRGPMSMLGQQPLGQQPLGPAPAPVAAAAAPGSTTGTWTDYFKRLTYVGFPISWFALLIFTGVIPFAPMSFLGYAGVNIMISGSYGWAAAKAGVQLASYLAGQFITAYFPELWHVSYLLAYSPWYIFDIVQMFDPRFPQLGFRTPFFTKPLGSNFDLVANTYGNITLVHIFVIIVIMSLGGYTLVDMLPTEITQSFKPLLKTIFKSVAGITGLIGEGMAAFTTMPSMFSALSGGGGQTGGGDQTGGSKEKTLDDIAKGFMKPDGEAQMAYLFIGALLTAALGGLALSATRA